MDIGSKAMVRVS